MGCVQSSNSKDQPLQIVKDRLKPALKSMRVADPEDSTCVVKSVRWKVVPTAEQARDKYEADGTLSKTSDPGHLELRQLLEEPMGQNYIGAYAKELQSQELFMCWVDVQEFKNIPTDSYRRSKGLHIYNKYIRTGAVLQLGYMDQQEEEHYKEILDQSKATGTPITKDFFDKIQSKCFSEMYTNVFVQFKKSPKYAEMERDLKSAYNKVQLDDFDFLSKLGEGGFGLVVHCRKRSTGRHYAMKIQTKKGLLECFADDPSRVAYEKNAFVACQHPFIVNLDYAFQTETLAIMVLGLATAGDLQYAINQTPDERLPDNRTQFYVAEIILALGHLHAMGLMYRDLKPNNILLNADGHIQLADFGGVVDSDGKTLGVKDATLSPLFAPANDENAHEPMTEDGSVRARRMSVMGTYGYMAPEMVVLMNENSKDQIGYTNVVDWWSLGVTMYKMLTGRKPFDHENAINTFFETNMSFFNPSSTGYASEYLDLFKEIMYPMYMSSNAIDFLKRLLDVNDKTRLGAGPNGLKDIKSHPYFDGMNWEKLEQKHLIPPYIPVARKLQEKAHYPSFDMMMANLRKTDWLEDKPRASDHKYYQGWDFVAPSTLKMEFGIANEMDQYDSKLKCRHILGDVGGVGVINTGRSTRQAASKNNNE
eukprot:CAMPEP_0182418880 /NCGR_PEP_ID=MMETSP1167-20130531/3258_1 /TAXON_ID=2988 /ORGANISM="Mallomonas Sp, Strain CCMP3275" /LENGTH=648 /DNA_ID=CAMNT_0024593337 /DNA_START=174 /DNA_END=2120 /DNA_ORIENTATION=-